MSTPLISPRAARLLARLAAVVVAVAGLAVLVLGLQRTAAFGGGEGVLGRLPRVDDPVVVTAPGMTELTGATVRIRAASADPSAPVFIGVGRSDDVEAYLGPVARTEITALEESGVLRMATRPGEARIPDPAGVDVWAASVRAGGVASLTWPRTPGSWRVVVATDGETPPSAVEVTWSGIAGSSPAPALIAVGAVLFVGGIAALLAMRSGRLFTAAARTSRAVRSARSDRSARSRRAAAPVEAVAPAPDPAAAGIPAPDEAAPELADPRPPDRPPTGRRRAAAVVEQPVGARSADGSDISDDGGSDDARSDRSDRSGLRNDQDDRDDRDDRDDEDDDEDEAPAVLPFRRGPATREAR